MNRRRGGGPWYIGLCMAVCAGCGSGSAPIVVDATDAVGIMDLVPTEIAEDTASEVALVFCSEAEDCAAWSIAPCNKAICRVSTGICEAVADVARDGDACAVEGPCRLTTGTCHQGQCQASVLADGTPCDLDHNDCTPDQCLAGLCVPGENTCLCDDATPCPTDNDLCNGDLECVAGLCQLRPDSIPECVDRLVACRDQVCDPATGQCAEIPHPNGAFCDDVDPCTIDDQCDGAGNCAGVPKACEDEDPCTIGSCTPGTGQCVQAPVGPTVFGCCALDADCDDRDPCTTEGCGADWRCSYAGEPAGSGGSGCVTGAHCDIGLCDSRTGTCTPANLALPVTVADWDLATGWMPSGFVWTWPNGELVAGGVRVVAGGAVTSFALPRHFVPAGVHVVLVSLARGSACDTVFEHLQVKVDGAAVTETSCVVDQGAATRGFVWTSTEVRVPDVQVMLLPGQIATRVTWFAWAAPGCRPLQEVRLTESMDATDLALVRDAGGVRVGYREGFHAKVVNLSNTGVVEQPVTLNEDAFSLGPFAFTTSLLDLGGGRSLIAYGGAGGVIHLRVLGADGGVTSEAVAPLVDAGDQQFEPDLARSGNNRIFMAFSSTRIDGNGLGVGLREVLVAADGAITFGAATGMAATVTGDQQRPKVAFDRDGGRVVWVHGDTTKTLMSRRIRLDGTPPSALDYGIGSPGVTTEMSLSGATDGLWITWKKAEGGVSGRLIDVADDPDVLFDSISWEGTPRIVALHDIALLFTATGNGMAKQNWVRPTGPDGKYRGDPFKVGPSSASDMVAEACSPFWTCYAYVDIEDEPGIHLGLAAPRCSDGMVKCNEGEAPAVCTQIGASGYTALPNASAWCPDTTREVGP